jgi:hypothetical protein
MKQQPFRATKLAVKLVLNIAAVGLLAILCVCGLFYAGIIVRYREPKTLSSLQFQQLEPKILPTGIRLTTKDLIASVNHHSQLEGLGLYIGFNKPEHSGITEQKSLEPENCARHIVDVATQTCHALRTPKGQNYTHLRGRHKDKDMNYEQIRFINGGTFIFIDANVGKKGFIPEAEWQATIDSFVPVDYKLAPQYSEPAV